MNLRKLFQALSFVAAPAMMLACSEAGDDDQNQDAANVGTVEAAFTGTSHYTVSASTYTKQNIGTSVGRSCFLAGIGGSLAGPPDGQQGAGVYIDNNGDYILFVNPMPGDPLRADARCAHSDAGRTQVKTWTTFLNGGPTKLGAVTPGRRCFLMEVVVSGAYAGIDTGFMHEDDYAKIWHDDSYWYLGGHVDGAAWVRAQCLDVSADYGSWEWVSGPGQNNVHSQPLTNETGATCLLTGIGGDFIFDDTNDGARVSKDDNLNQYFLRTENSKHGWANCVKLPPTRGQPEHARPRPPARHRRPQPVADGTRRGRAAPSGAPTQTG